MIERETISVIHINFAKYGTRQPTIYKVKINYQDGNGASGKLAVMHYYHDHDHEYPTSNQKRDVSRPIDQCGGSLSGWTARESHCTGPQTFSIVCISPRVPTRARAILYQGTCAENEVCINGVPSKGGFLHQRAYCVSKANFVEIAQDQPNIETVSLPQSGSDDRTPRRLISQAVLTAADGKSPLVAKNISITAYQDANDGTPLSYVPSANGTSWCIDCNRVGIDPVPVNASLLEAQVILNSAEATGSLFLVTIDV